MVQGQTQSYPVFYFCVFYAFLAFKGSSFSDCVYCYCTKSMRNLYFQFFNVPCLAGIRLFIMYILNSTDAWEIFSVSSAVKGASFESGKENQPKETDGFRLSSAVPKINKPRTPIVPTAIRLWELLTLVCY